MNLSRINNFFHRKTGLLFIIPVLYLLFNAFSAYAATGTIQYGYDENLQLIKVTYADGTNVDYVYDNMGNSTSKTTTFTGAPTNNAPDAASNPYIPDGAIDTTTAPVLSWTGGDPDGDPVVYYIYLGDSMNPPLLASGTQTGFTTGQLRSYTTYYWKIVTRDNHNAFTEGPLWSFTTENNPPVASFSADSTVGMAPFSVKFTDSSYDVDDEIVSWEWDFDNDSVIDSTEQSPRFIFTSEGVYTVSLKVTDAQGANSTETKIDYITANIDSDEDGVVDAADNCPFVYNIDQYNQDSHLDNLGDACDPDADGDGYDNELDVCPLLAADNNQQDSDGDGYGDACTVNHCVSDSAELQNALNNAIGNNMDDVIKLVQGTYGVSGNSGNMFSYDTLKLHSLVIQGGYTAGCVTRDADPVNTILDGEGTAQVLNYNVSNGTFFTKFLIEDITIRNGTGGIASRLQNGQTIFRNNIIEDNNAVYYAGVNIIQDNGQVIMVNNVIARNTATNFGGGLTLDTQRGTLHLINNTITENTVLANWGFGSGILVRMRNALSTADIYNNIIRSNSVTTGEAFFIDYNEGTTNVFNNNLDFTNVTGSFTSKANNIDMDPLFVDPAGGDYHLSLGSACIDAGDSTAPSLPSEDFEGDARILATAPDMGADEYFTGGTTYTISGRILLNSSGLAGVRVGLAGDASAVKISDDNGNYSFAWIGDGSYTVTPMDTMYDYIPTSKAVTIIGADVTGQDFSTDYKDSDGDGVYDYEDNCIDDQNSNQADADNDGYGDVCDLPGTISGRVTNEDTGLPIAGIFVFMFTGPSGGTDYTDADGNYTITGLKNGSYTVLATSSGYIDEYYDDEMSSSYAALVKVYPEQDTSGIDFALAPDMDDDGITDLADNCPAVYNPSQSNLDSQVDNIGDACDDDVDGDGISDDVDACPLLYRDVVADGPHPDADGDGYGDECTVDHCVTTVAELQTALTDAQNNDMNDVIKVVQGAYNIGSQLSYSSSQYYSLAVRGGYTDGTCSARDADAANTALDGGGTLNILRFNSNVSSDYPHHVLVEDVTVQNGKTGIFAVSNSARSDVTIRNSIITDNGYNYDGGGIYTSTGNGTITLLANTIKNNDSNAYAGAYVASTKGDLEIVNNIITGNSVNYYAGGVYASTQGSIRFINNTVAGNTATQSGAGLHLPLNTTLDIYNNIFRNNTAPNGGDVYIQNSSSTVNAFNNNINPAKVYGTFTSEGNNINTDPQFVDAANGDYHLTSASPCIDIGSNSAPSLPLYDFEGETRIYDGDDDTTATTDMGADEYMTTCADPVWIFNTAFYYSSLQTAYDMSVDDDIIWIQSVVFAGGLTIDINKTITFEVGYDCDYDENTEETVIQGDMTITDGKLTIDSGKLVIE